MKRFARRFLDVLRYIGRRRIALMAAGAAFWTFVSLVPMLLVMMSILPYTSITQEQIMNALAEVAPAAINNLLNTIVADVYQSSVAVLSVTVLVAVWSAGMGFSTLIQGMEIINRQEKLPNYFVRRFRGILFAISLIVVIFLYVVIMGFGRLIVDMIEGHFPGTQTLFTFLMRFRFLIIIALLTLVFIGIYRWSTGDRPAFRKIWPGALLSAIGWSVFSSVFSIWVSMGGYGTYGRLATVVIAMLWLYFCMYILLLGACFNRALPQIRPKRWDSREV